MKDSIQQRDTHHYTWTVDARNSASARAVHAQHRFGLVHVVFRMLAELCIYNQTQLKIVCPNSDRVASNPICGVASAVPSRPGTVTLAHVLWFLD